MTNTLIPHKIHNALFKTWRTEERNGKKYIVVRGVPLVEGVLNGRYVPSEEFGAFVKDWNAVPVVMRHPKKNGGSARVPEPDVPVVGSFYGAGLDGNRLVGDFWLEENKLNDPDGETIKARLKAQLPIEISTGYYAESIPQIGKWNEKDYNLIDRNIHPDHIALLPDELGACNIEDGCGLNRNSSMANFDISIAIQNVTGLTGKASEIWEEVYQSYKEELGEEQAAERAWGAVKKSYKKENGQWVKKNELVDIVEFIENHYGPGNHKDGSSQKVHGGGGGGGGKKSVPSKQSVSVSELNDYEKSLHKIYQKAQSMGVKTYNSSLAEGYSREAASVINGQRKSGYTVYNSPQMALDITDLSTDKYFAGVGYGAGESKGEIGEMVSILKGNGYTAFNTREGFIVVDHPSWKMKKNHLGISRSELEGLASLVAFVTD